MSTLTIRKLDESVKQRLRLRAAKKGASMEAEARAILEAAVRELPAAQRVEAIGRVRGRWKGRITTDAILNSTRGD